MDISCLCSDSFSNRIHRQKTIESTVSRGIVLLSLNIGAVDSLESMYINISTPQPVLG